MTKTIILSTGGTGGHVFPALSLAEELKSRGYDITLMTDERGARYHDSSLFSSVICYPLDQGKGRLGKIRQLWYMLKVAAKVIRTFNKNSPAVVVGFGGYTSAPVMMAAVLCRIPTLIHEQNAVLGRVNRILGKYANALDVAFENTVGVDNIPVRVVGNPVRVSIRDLSAQEYSHPHGKLRIFVVGGSQGAKIFSDIIPQAVAGLPVAHRKHLQIIQQCRPEYVEETRESYKQIGVHATVEPFFKDIEIQYSHADLVIARAGAMTVAEIAVAGKAALFVPYALAMDNHQYQNARNLNEAGAAWMLQEKEFTPSKLASLLTEILSSPQLLVNRAQKIRNFAHLDAASTLADHVEDLLRTR